MEGLVLSDLAKDLLINIINILILFLIVRTLAYKPVKKFLEERKARIEQQLADAAEKQQSADTVLAEYQTLIEDSKAKADAMIREGEKRAQQNAQEITAAAKKEAEEIKKTALQQAEKEKQKTLADMQGDITSLAFSISEKVLAREVTDEDNQRIAEAFFAQYHAE